MSSIKSRPIYDKLVLDPAGARHLLLTDRPEPPEDAFVDGIAPMAALEVWGIAANSRVIAGPAELDDAPASTRLFRSRTQMLDRLDVRLASERMGLRLYAIGTEDFVWDVRNLGARYGMGPHEVRVAHHGSLRRRVVCVHCRSVMEGVTTSIVDCAGCGARLFVRDHFSRRLGGFQGVMVDAEVPGEVPDSEVLYS